MLFNTNVSTTDYEISQSHNNDYKMVSRDLEVVKTYLLSGTTPTFAMKN